MRLADAIREQALPASRARRSRPSPGEDRGCTMRPIGGGLARYLRVLYMAGKHQRAVDPGEGLLLYRRGGGLAGLLRGEPLHQGLSGLWKERPRGAAGLPEVAYLDVGQRGDPRARRVATAVQRRATGGGESRLLRAGRLQLVGLDGGGDRVPRTRRSGSGRYRPARLQVL